MKSLDPWNPIVIDSSGVVVVPAPVYEHPFYREVPSWIHYGNHGGTRRVLFDGAFVGAEVPVPPQRTGLTAEVAPVVAPATGGLTFRKQLDDKQVLHVEICVDGKCYQTSMDLAPAITLVMDKLARWHRDMHAQTGQKVSDAAVIGCVEAAVGEASDLIIGGLLERHVDCVCGSFLGDIAGAVTGVVKTVTHAASGVASGVADTFKKLKGPIAAAASTAAAAAAAAIPGVGPIAAPIAGKLANDLVQAAAGSGSAKKPVATANQQAKSDPAVAVALDVATKAVANATVAHHVQATAQKATQGDTGSAAADRAGRD